MTKVYTKEIKYCPECPHFSYNDSFTLSEGWLCNKTMKIIAPIVKIVRFIPEWCPLKDLEMKEHDR